MILRIRAPWAALVLISCVALFTGCGNEFRPTINFLPTPSGNPTSQENAVVLSTNPSPGNAGSDTHIDVDGDTSVAVVNVGVDPVFLGKAGARAFVLNSDNSITLYQALIVSALSGALPTTTTSALPSNTTGAIGGAASSNGNIYIAEQACTGLPTPTPTPTPSPTPTPTPTPSPTPPVGCVSVIPSGTTSADPNQTVPAGSQPVMVVANAAGSEAFAINHGDGTVTIIGTQDNSVIVPNLHVGSQPIWGVMSDDGVQVYIVNQGDGTVSVIDTTLNIVFTTLFLDGQGPNPALNSNYAFFDPNFRRVYVSNPGDNSITIIKADSINLGDDPQILPTVLAHVPVSGSPISVGAIADGTRAYAALGNCPVGTNHTNLLTEMGSCTGNQVSVIDVLSFAESKLIPVGTSPVWLAVSADGSRVYTSNALNQNMSVISTTTDSEVVRMPAPQQSLGCPNPGCGVSGTQTPFMVQTFP